jgi:PPOX class probable F420-dependent enzyme
MDLDAARDFLKDNHRAILVTLRRDGGLQTSPVGAVTDGNGYAVISSRETAYKTRNLRRDPRATLCVMNDGFYGRWIQVDGRAEIVSLPEAMEPLVDYYRRMAGEHPDWDDYRAAMRKEQRCLIRIQIERAGPDRAG